MSYEEQIMSKDKYIFAPNGGYCVYYPPHFIRNARSFENWGVFNNNSMSAR